jgi:hypothetical protein
MGPTICELRQHGDSLAHLHDCRVAAVVALSIHMKTSASGDHVRPVFTVDGDAPSLSVRWLADLCGLPATSVPPCLASTLLAQPDHTAVAAHVAHWARNPDPGSTFARTIGRLPDVPDAVLAAALGQRGYDGLVYVDGKEIVGHCFFQRRDDELHGFAVWVAGHQRGGRLMAIACFDFIAYASACPGIVRARIGTGHPADRLLAPLKPVSAKLGWRVRKGAWVDFQHGEL